MSSLINTEIHPSFFETPNTPIQSAQNLQQIYYDDSFPRYVNNSNGDTPLYEQVSKENYASKVLAGIQEVSQFSLLFFSHQNIKEIQRNIRYSVYKYTDSKHVIGNQDETELVIIMRGIYLQYSKIPAIEYLYTNEIRRLNDLVVNALLKDLISNIEQYVLYLRDSTQNLRPLDNGISTSITGERMNRTMSDVLIGDSAFYKASEMYYS